MTDEVGEALLPFIEGGGPADHERNAAVAIGRFYAQHGYLTPAMRATAWWLLDNHGKAVGERPETDDTLPVAPAIPTAAPRAFVGKKKSEVKFWVAEGMIRSATPFSLKDLCKSVPGRSWNPLLKLWEWAAGPTAAQNLLDTFGKYDPDTDDGFKALLAKIETTRAFKVATDLPDLTSVKTVSWMHQRQAFHFIRPMVGAMLAMDMGEQPAWARVLTPSGWVAFGSLEVGDELIGPAGVVTVEEVKPWAERELWRVHTADGGVADCSPTHLWTVKGQNGGWVTKPLADIEATLGADHWQRLDKLPPLSPVELPERDLPLDPYVLGVLLSEGGISTGKLRFRSDLPALVEEVRSRGYNVSTQGDGRYHNIVGLGPKEMLRRLGLTGATSSTKHIPQDYLWGSVAQRRDLLRGLMDGDGSIAGRSAYLTTVSPTMAQQVSALARSLGGAGSVSLCTRPTAGGHGEYRVTGLGADPFLVRPNLPAGRTMLRRISYVEKTGTRCFQRCIRVSDPDGLYVTDDYIVTHNTGKSLTTVARILDDPPGHTFIACPAKVVGVWPREFRNHGAVDVHIENGIRPKRGGGYKALTVKERVEAYDELRRCTCGRHHIAVSNYEVVIAEPLKSFLMAHTWDMLVMDESQRIQAYNGAQSKQLGKVGNKKAGARLALTGTPLGQSPLSIFGQYRALDQNIFGPSFTSFRNRYAIMGGYEGREIIGMNPATADELTAKIYQYAFRVLSDDVLDLPEVLPDEILTCTMEGAQARAYRDMEREAAAEFPGKTVSEVVAAIVNGESVAPNVLTKMLRLRQITGGGIKDDESGQSLILGDAKEKLLADWMMDFPAGEPLVVFAEFTHDIGAIRRVAEKQGRAYGEVSGQRNDLTADSEYPEGVEVLAVQIASGGAGVDLTRSCYGCYYSKSYSNEKYRQSRKRLHRPGQTRPVRFTHLVAADTVDEDAVANLDAIEAVNEGVLRQ